MNIIVTANKKGGVGKTTTTQNLASMFARAGKKVLAIDFDPQTNLSQSWGINEDGTKTVIDVLRQQATWQDIMVLVEKESRGGCVWLAPANRELATMPICFAEEFGKEYILKEALLKNESSFDIILIDSPPSLDLLAINTYTAATEILIPVQCEYYALEGLKLMGDDLQRVRHRLNPQLRLLAIVPTLVDKRKRLCRDILELLNKEFDGIVTNTTIRDNIALAEAPSNGQSIFKYAPKAHGAEDYNALGKELLKRLQEVKSNV